MKRIQILGISLGAADGCNLQVNLVESGKLVMMCSCYFSSWFTVTELFFRHLMLR